VLVHWPILVAAPQAQARFVLRLAALLTGLGHHGWLTAAG